MPRLLTGENNPLYVAMEVALVCYLVHTYMKGTSMEMKAMTVGAVMGLYEMYLQQNNTNVSVRES